MVLSTPGNTQKTLETQFPAFFVFFLTLDKNMIFYRQF